MPSASPVASRFGRTCGADPPTGKRAGGAPRFQFRRSGLPGFVDRGVGGCLALQNLLPGFPRIGSQVFPVARVSFLAAHQEVAAQKVRRTLSEHRISQAIGRGGFRKTRGFFSVPQHQHVIDTLRGQYRS